MFHTLNRKLEVWRRASAPDGAGGQTSVYGLVGTVRAKLAQPTAREQVEAEAADASHSQAITLPPKADVRRGDELRGGGQRWRVKAVVGPSTPDYRHADCELLQAEVS